MKDFLKIQDMNIKYNILPLFAAVSLLTACSDDDIDRVYTVGEADNAIVLKVGVREGSGTQIATRGEVDGNHDATNKTDGSNVYGGGHTPFKAIGTKLALRIDGTWTGHSPATISQQTIATVDDVATNTDGKHNLLSGYNPVRYWDDYGTADPDNATGRIAGLTIYGIGVDGYAATYGSSESSPTNWKEVAWNVGVPTDGLIDQSNTTNYWLAKDLLTSNNIRSDVDGTYKFDDYLYDKTATTKRSSNILEFTHAMTKITVQLTAGEGFPGYETNTESAAFQTAPTVTLEGFYYKGSVNVEDKISTKNDDKANIKMHLNEGGAAHTATFDALVFPGNVFADDKQILTFTADGNTLHVTAAKLNEAIQSAIVNTSTTKYPGNNNTLLQAWNYLLKITVKKTDLDITATILNWNTVVAEEESPKINVDKVYGHEGSAFAQNFDFFRSTTKASGYSKDAWVEHTEASGTHTYTFHNQLYWPDHQTHYFFRGVYPRVQTDSQADSQAGWIPTNKVSSSTSSASTIAVSNVAYEEGKYPSDLAFGWPKKDNDVDSDETCKVHTDKQGICATEGQIRMNFKYVMSKVQFSLRSTGTAPLGNIVDLSNVKVEIIDGYTQGKIRLSDGLHEVYAAEDKGDYALNVRHTPADTYTVYTLDAIVPQALNDATLRITIQDSESNVLDVYEIALSGIKENNTSKTPITEWLPGNYYKYYLDINKTAINVTATLTDWVTVEARDEVWF